MIRKIFILGMSVRAMLVLSVLLMAGVPGLAAAASARTTLRAVSAVQADGGIRLTFDTSDTTTHKLFTLERPDRIVIDLRNTRLGRGVRMPAGTGVIDTIRTGARPDGTLRVVIELKSRVPARGQWLAPSGEAGSQLVVAVGRGVSMGAGVAAAGSATTSGAASKPLVVDNSPPRPVRAAHAPADSDRDVIVAVDAGHGGQDPGAIGRDGTQEKDVVLAISRALAARINAETGMRAVLTRDNDYFVVLRDRMVRARNAKADLFVSIHADSIRDRNISGASVYVLSERGASSEAARWLAERENAADLMGGVKLDDKEKSLASVLLDLSQTASLSASMTAAERVLSSLDRTVEVRKPHVQQAGLIVLKSPDIPSMLVETAYISNPREEARLRTDRHQVKLAEAIFSGLRGYFEVNPPPGTRFAQLRHSQLAGIMASPAMP